MLWRFSAALAGKAKGRGMVVNEAVDDIDIEVGRQDESR
jgi:hypothetical protein